MRRLVVVLLPLFVVPLIALSVLAWSLAGQAEGQVLATQRQQHVQTIEACERQIGRQVERLALEYSQWAQEALREPASAAAPPASPVWVLICDRQGQWYWPAIHNIPAHLPPSGGSDADGAWLEDLAKAARQEQSAGAAALAAELYRELDREGVPEPVRAAAVLGLARIARRQNRIEQATELYRRAMVDFAATVDETGLNYGAEAGAAYVRFAQALGDAAMATAAWRQHADGLLAQRYPMSWVLAIEHLKDAIAQAPSEPSEPDAARRERLREAAERLEQMASAAGAVPALAHAGAAQFVPRDGMILLVLAVGGPEAPRTAVAAFDAGDLREHLLGPLAEAARRLPVQGVCIRDKTGHLLAGEAVAPEAVTQRASLLRWGLPWTLEVGFADLAGLHAQGVRRHALLSGSIVGLVALIGAGTVLGWRMVRREVELSRLKSDFVDNVSHELRTPVTSIKLFSEMLHSGQIRDPERQREYYRLLTSESDRLMRMVENMLNFSRIVAGRLRLHPQPTDMGEYLKGLLTQLEVQARPTGHRIHLHLGRDLPVCRIDRDSFSRAVMNLVSNAIKYSPDEPEITLTAQRRDGLFSLTVRDRGVGIAPEDLPHVFDRFYRARHGNCEHIQGTGLGLTIVKDTVQRHSGQVRIESRPGAGTVVEMLIPIEAEARPS